MVPGIAGLVLSSKIPTLAKDAYSLPLMQAHVPWVFAASVVATIGAIAALLLVRRQREWAVVALAASGFIGGQLLMYGHDPQGRYSAGIDLVPAINAEMTPQTTLYVVGKYEQSLPFYLRRTMTMVQHMDELEFGIGQQPELWIPTIDAFATKWTADHVAGKKDIAIIRPENYRELEQKGVPMRVIGQDPRRVVVTNQGIPAAAAPATAAPAATATPEPAPAAEAPAPSSAPAAPY